MTMIAGATAFGLPFMIADTLETRVGADSIVPTTEHLGIQSNVHGFSRKLYIFGDHVCVGAAGNGRRADLIITFLKDNIRNREPGVREKVTNLLESYTDEYDTSDNSEVSLLMFVYDSEQGFCKLHYWNTDNKQVRLFRNEAWYIGSASEEVGRFFVHGVPGADVTIDDSLDENQKIQRFCLDKICKALHQEMIDGRSVEDSFGFAYEYCYWDSNELRFKMGRPCSYICLSLKYDWSWRLITPEEERLKCWMRNWYEGERLKVLTLNRLADRSVCLGLSSIYHEMLEVVTGNGLGSVQDDEHVICMIDLDCPFIEENQLRIIETYGDTPVQFNRSEGGISLYVNIRQISNVVYSIADI